MIHKILRLFVQTLIVEDKHYLLNRDDLTQPFQMQLYREEKKISEFFTCISKIYIKFYTYAKKKMTLIDDVFPKIPAPKNMVR